MKEYRVTMKVRVKYAKTGPLKFISHLDVMRYFQKNIRRAGLDIAYSTGLSPHQIISFAAPMPLMLTSLAEYFDAEFNSVPDHDEMIRRLNATGTPFMEVLDAAILPEKCLNSMAAVTASSYRVTLSEKGEKMIGEAFHGKIHSVTEELLKEEELVIMKKTKKNLLPVNIRPMIHRLSVEDQGLIMLLTAGSIENLKPEQLLPEVCTRTGVPYDRFFFDLLRMETYTGTFGTEDFQPLIAMGNREF